MGTVFLDQLKRQASTFLQEKYKTARLVLTDVTPAEILTEDATNSDPCTPDACTMTRIAEASYDVDDYWRVVDVLHRRLQTVDWKLWRQSYKTLVLLEFLLTHGPDEFAEEFDSDNAIIEELATFKHVDDKGFNWGEKMQKKANQILKLTSDEKALKEARLKALKVTKEIQGFGSASSSPPSSSSLSSPSYFNHSSPREAQQNYSQGGIRDDNHHGASTRSSTTGKSKTHLWDIKATRETGLLLEQEQDGYGTGYDGDGDRHGYMSEIYSKLANLSPTKGKVEKGGFRSLSDAGKVMRKKFDRQFSIGY